MYLLCLYAIIACSFIQSAHDSTIEIGGGQAVLLNYASKHLETRYGASLDSELATYLALRNDQSWHSCTDIEQLQRYALISVAFQEKSCFENVTNRIAQLNPACVNDYYPSGSTLLLSVVNISHSTPALRNMTQHLMRVFGTHLDVNKGMEDSDTSPLFFAAQEGNSHICSLLLQHKEIKIDKPRKDGSTPFAIAAEWGHMDVLTLFEKYRKNVNANNYADYGITPLLSSITPKKDVQSGLVVTIPQIVPMYLVSTWKANVNLGNHAGIMPLFLAVLNQKFDLADFLIDKKAKCDHCLPQYNYNVLHYMGISTDGIKDDNPRDISVQDVPKLKLLIKKIIGKNNKHLFSALTSNGDAPSHLVVTSENAPNLIKAFFEGAKSVGVDAIRIPDSEGRTALHKVVLGGDVGLVEYLLKQGANPWIKDNGDCTALDIVQMGNGDDDIVKLLQSQMKKMKPPVVARERKQKTSSGQQSIEPIVTQKSSLVSSGNNGSDKKTIKVDSSFLFDYSVLPSPEGVIALRQTTETPKILVGYKCEGSFGRYEVIDSNRYAPSACKEGDLYHAFDRAIDPYIVKDGYIISADQQDAHQELLHTYGIKIRANHAAYVLPGRIENQWYNTRYALRDKEVVDPFRGHSGAFVLIMNDEGTIVHRQFHPSQEQKSIRKALQ